MKTLLTLIAVLLATAPAAAQEWTGGLKVGGTLTTFSGETVNPLDPAVGWAGGFALGYDFGTGLVVLPEILYAVKGAYTDSAIDGVPVRLQSVISYVEIPILVMYRRPYGPLHPKVYAGPFLARKLDATVRLRARGGAIEQTDPDDTVEPGDYGAVAGVGMDWDAGTTRLSLEVRGVFGLTNVREIDPALRNTGAVVLLGLLF